MGIRSIADLISELPAHKKSRPDRGPFTLVRKPRLRTFSRITSYNVCYTKLLRCFLTDRGYFTLLRKPRLRTFRLNNPASRQRLTAELRFTLGTTVLNLTSTTGIQVTTKHVDSRARRMEPPGSCVYRVASTSRGWTTTLFGSRSMRGARRGTCTSGISRNNFV